MSDPTPDELLKATLNEVERLSCDESWDDDGSCPDQDVPLYDWCIYCLVGSQHIACKAGNLPGEWRIAWVEKLREAAAEFADEEAYDNRHREDREKIAALEAERDELKDYKNAALAVGTMDEDALVNRHNVWAVKEIAALEAELMKAGFRKSADRKLWVPPVNEVAARLHKEIAALEALLTDTMEAVCCHSYWISANPDLVKRLYAAGFRHQHFGDVIPEAKPDE